MPLLELKDITYRTAERVILAGLSLTVAAGEVHALLGTNGTGKSSLAYLVMGCEGYAPNRGVVVFAGQTINALKLYERARLGISLAWQEPVRFEGLTVRDYLQLWEKDGDAAASLRLVGLEPSRSTSVSACCTSAAPSASLWRWCWNRGRRPPSSTLMAHGLTPEEAVAVIVKGILA